MKLPDTFLDQVFRRARRVPESPLPCGSPNGFATRVLAQWRAAERRDWTLWLLPRAIGAAAVITAGMLALQSSSPAGEEHEIAGIVMISALEVQP